MQFVVGVVRAEVVEFRNPGGGTLTARESVAGVVERGVVQVEHVNLTGVRARLVSVVSGKDNVVAAACRK